MPRAFVVRAVSFGDAERIFDMAGDEPVIAPDQLKPGHPKAFRIAGVLTVIALLLMLIGNNGHVEDWWLGGTALGIVFFIVADAVMRRKGLKH
jgi:hypothetical protein